MGVEGSVIFEKQPRENLRSVQSVISVEGLTRVFGQDPERALKLRRSGRSKDEIHEETGNTLALYNVSFEITRRNLSLWAFREGNPRSSGASTDSSSLRVARY